jgi:hypothetical protein
MVNTTWMQMADSEQPPQCMTHILPPASLLVAELQRCGLARCLSGQSLTTATVQHAAGLQIGATQLSEQCSNYCLQLYLGICRVANMISRAKSLVPVRLMAPLWGQAHP